MTKLESPVPAAVLHDVFKKSAGALDAAGARYVVSGAFAFWGAAGIEPANDEDIDFFIAADDLPAAERELTTAGFRIEHPPEGWLTKALWQADDLPAVVVDLIHDPSGLQVDQELLQRARPANLLGMQVRVLDMTDMLITKLTALGESELDYTSCLQIARAAREQIDWQRLQTHTADSAYARAFVFLLGELEIAG